MKGASAALTTMLGRRSSTCARYCSSERGTTSPPSVERRYCLETPKPRASRVHVIDLAARARSTCDAKSSTVPSVPRMLWANTGGRYGAGVAAATNGHAVAAGVRSRMGGADGAAARMFIRAAPQLGREAVAPHEPGLLLEALRRGGDRVGVHGPGACAAGQELAAVLQAEPSLLALAVPPDRTGEPAGLLAPEQIRAVDPATIQVGLHRLGGLFRARRHVDAHDLEVGVAAGIGKQVAVADLQVAVAGEPAQASEQRGGLPGAGWATVREQERPGVGGGQVRDVADPIPAPGEQVGGEADPSAGGQ